MGGFCGHPVGGEVIVTNPDRTRNASGGIPSLRSLFFHVLPLERLGLGQGSLRVLHLLELLGDHLDSAVHEIADCRAHGLRAAREVVDLHEEVECPQVARGQAQRDLFRVRISHPVHAIIAPLSMHRSPGGTNIFAPRSEAIWPTISCSRRLRATPPPRRTSSLPTWAIARSVTSVSIAKATSWIENARSATDAPCLRRARAAVSIPLNATSMPLTLYGSARSFDPSRASFSRIGPPGNASPHSRANLSSRFPTPMSSVSPKTR